MNIFMGQGIVIFLENNIHKPIYKGQKKDTNQRPYRCVYLNFDDVSRGCGKFYQNVMIKLVENLYTLHYALANDSESVYMEFSKKKFFLTYHYEICLWKKLGLSKLRKLFLNI